MKLTITHLVTLGAILLLPAIGAAEAAPSTPPPAPPPVGERIPPERLDLKVLKVFEARDGEAIFRAYVVSWKGQEVVVNDSLARTNHKEGDVISVLAMNHPFPLGAQPHRLLAFTVIAPPR